MTGTELYRKMLAFDYGDAERSDLMARVWRGTPWLVDAYTGQSADDRDMEMREWCHDHFGTEARPIHGTAGRWQRGSATIYGWTWFGFETEEMMNAFISEWPNPPMAKDQAA